MVEKVNMNHFSHYINGGWVGSSDKKKRSILTPYDSTLICEVSEGSKDDVLIAVKAAREAFDNKYYHTLNKLDRSKILAKLSQKIIEDKEELAKLESINTGKTMEESRWDMDDIANVFSYYAGLIKNDVDRKITNIKADVESEIIKEPIGVCSLILPWNYPLLQASWKIAPAFAAGCSMIIKPSELTPLTTIKLMEYIDEFNLPKGVFNLVLGDGINVGEEMSKNTSIDMVSFTGGIETGKRIMRNAADNVKKVTLELGGKNPHIIFKDADLDTALDFICNGVFFHCGQICSAGSRVLIEKDIFDELSRKIVEKAEKIKLGFPFEKDVQMGSLVSQKQLDKVEYYIESAKKEGAKILLGGSQPNDNRLSKGYFYLPTVITNCNSKMEIVQNEVFGPVITLESFENMEEAVSLANDTIYGLSAGFWTSDQVKMDYLSSNLRFGTVWINDFNVYYPYAPWGGYKQSGIGRELSDEGLLEYYEIKHIYKNKNNKPAGWF